MAIDLEGIYLRCIQAAELVVGDLVAKTGSGIPAIVRGYEKRASNLYPILLVDIQQRRGSESSSLFSYTNSSGEKETYTVYHYFITYSAYSNNSSMAQSIIENLSAGLLRQDVINIFQDGGLGTPAEIFDVTTRFIKSGDEAICQSLFDFKLSVCDRLLESEDVVERIENEFTLMYPLQLKINPN